MVGYSNDGGRAREARFEHILGLIPSFGGAAVVEVTNCYGGTKTRRRRGRPYTVQFEDHERLARINQQRNRLRDHGVDDATLRTGLVVYQGELPRQHDLNFAARVPQYEESRLSSVIRAMVGTEQHSSVDVGFLETMLEESRSSRWPLSAMLSPPRRRSRLYAQRRPHQGSFRGGIQAAKGFILEQYTQRLFDETIFDLAVPALTKTNVFIPKPSGVRGSSKKRYIETDVLVIADPEHLPLIIEEFEQRYCDFRRTSNQWPVDDGRKSSDTPAVRPSHAHRF